MNTAKCCLFLCFSSYFSYSYTQKLGDKTFSLGFNRLEYTNRFTNSADLGVEYFVTDNLALNYHLRIGYSNEEKLTGHIPIGLGLGVFVVLNSNFIDETVNYLAILLAVTPEGVTYYFSKNEKSSIGIYANVLGIDFWQKRPSLPMTINSGVKGNIWLNREQSFGAGGYAGPVYQYTGQQWGFQAAIGLKWKLQ